MSQLPYSKWSTNLRLSCDIQYCILWHHHYVCLCVWAKKFKSSGIALSIISFVSGTDSFIQLASSLCLHSKRVANYCSACTNVIATTYGSVPRFWSSGESPIWWSPSIGFGPISILTCGWLLGGTTPLWATLILSWQWLVILLLSYLGFFVCDCVSMYVFLCVIMFEGMRCDGGWTFCQPSME